MYFFACVCVCVCAGCVVGGFAACPCYPRSQRFDHKNCRRNHRRSIGVVRGSLAAVNGTALITSNATSYGGLLKWGYSQIIHFHWIFPLKPSILGVPPFMETPI